MNSILNKNLFFVKEHVGMFKAANNYDIYDPNSQEMMMTCREENLGFFTKMLRFTDYKRMTPFNIEIKTATGEKVLTVKRGVAFFVSKVEVFDENDQLVGTFKQKFFSIGGKFNLFDANDNMLCMLKGKWTSWDFRFIKDEVEFAHVSKKWAGIGKELFTTADNYMLEVDQRVPENSPIRIMILAAVMCIDMVLKE
ncbi:phospholipid scramblase-related protein [Plebeiibacterium sediminum]|uniref:Phospholipid scramblase family protein n=1 Tax=Plebeiibacterium sediminum TaxID=2992112 RepID=A0AAE3SHA3_9BACT|nr:phospholipid scramblase-related protein [Plebeiobacterium sediminum]MCW3789181.1 phospholipid scramblase family protein [Plebeiobacterium sediminum]